MESQQFNKKIRVLVYYQDQKILDKNFLQGPVLFGRSSDCQISLDYNFLSRHHAKIIQENQKIYLVDLKSRNGVQVGLNWIDKIEINPPFEFKIDRLRCEVILEEILQIHEKTKLTFQDQETQIPNKSSVHMGGSAAVVSKSHSISQSASQSILKTKTEKSNNINPSDEKKAVYVKTNEREGSEDIPHLDLIDFHPGVRVKGPKRLESVLMWKDQLLEVKNFQIGEKIYLGPGTFSPSENQHISVPTIEVGWALCRVKNENQGAMCFIPFDKAFRIGREGHYFSVEDLIQSQFIQVQKKGYSFHLTLLDVLELNLGNQLKLYLRWIPRASRLSTNSLVQPKVETKQAYLISAIAHAILTLFLILNPVTSTLYNQSSLKNGDGTKKDLNSFNNSRLKLLVPRHLMYSANNLSNDGDSRTIASEVVSSSNTLFVPTTVVSTTLPANYKITTPLITLPHEDPEELSSEELTSEEVADVENPKVDISKVNNSKVTMPKVPTTTLNRKISAKNTNPKSIDNLIKTLPKKKTLKVTDSSITGGGVAKQNSFKERQPNSEISVNPFADSNSVEILSLSMMSTEGLKNHQVMSKVETQLKNLKDCFNKFRKNDSSLKGSMDIEWEISSFGEVESIQVKKTNIPHSEALVECVKEVFMLIKFPSATNNKNTAPFIQLYFK